MRHHTERFFRLHPIASFNWGSWGDEHVVFDESSGQTHLLDSMKAYILEVLSDGSTSSSNLVCLLEQALVVPADADLHDVVLRALEQLERAQLIEAVPL